VRPRELADGPTLAQVCLDQISPDVHPETSSPGCLRCLDTSAAEVSPMSWSHTPLCPPMWCPRTSRTDVSTGARRHRIRGLAPLERLVASARKNPTHRRIAESSNARSHVIDALTPTLLRSDPHL